MSTVPRTEKTKGKAMASDGRLEGNFVSAKEAARLPSTRTLPRSKEGRRRWKKERVKTIHPLRTL